MSLKNNLKKIATALVLVATLSNCATTKRVSKSEAKLLSEYHIDESAVVEADTKTRRKLILLEQLMENYEAKLEKLSKNKDEKGLEKLQAELIMIDAIIEDVSLAGVDIKYLEAELEKVTNELLFSEL
jgi:hypothetical protein